MFKKKKQEPEYTTYEADDYYGYDYSENYAQPDYSEPSNIKSKKKPSKKKKDVSESNNYYEESYKELTEVKRSNWASKIVIALGIYFIFLLIGIFSTSFTINDIGRNQAQIINVQLREERTSYYALRTYYSDINSLLKNINTVDVQLQDNGMTKSFTLATEYQGILADIDKKLSKAKAITVDSKYTSLKTQETTTYNDAAVYLQKVSTALTNQDETALNDAMQYRDQLITDYTNLYGNMNEFASYVKINDPNFKGDFTSPLQKLNIKANQTASADTASGENPTNTNNPAATGASKEQTTK